MIFSPFISKISSPTLIPALNAGVFFPTLITLSFLPNDKVLLNPSFDRVYNKGEELIGIAEDDSTFIYDKVIQKKQILANFNN